MRECRKAHGKEEDGADEDDGAVREKCCEHAAKEPIEGARVRIVHALVHFFDANQIIAKKWRDHNGDYPT